MITTNCHSCFTSDSSSDSSRQYLCKHIDSDLAKMIIKNQMPQKEKMKKADIILYNDGTLDELTRKTKMIIEDIIRRK